MSFSPPVGYSCTSPGRSASLVADSSGWYRLQESAAERAIEPCPLVLGGQAASPGPTFASGAIEAWVGLESVCITEINGREAFNILLSQLLLLPGKLAARPSEPHKRSTKM